MPFEIKHVCVCRILMDAEYKKKFAILFTKVLVHLLIRIVEHSDAFRIILTVVKTRVIAFVLWTVPKLLNFIELSLQLAML